jgi:hypothetical protein
MKPFFFNLTQFKYTSFYIPSQFRESETSIRNYKTLMMIYQTVSKDSNYIMLFFDKIQDLTIPEPVLRMNYKNYDVIMTFVKKFQDLTDSEKVLKFKVIQFKEEILNCRRQYILKKWRPEDSERLHNEMTMAFSDLFRKHYEIGELWRKVKALRR